MFLGRSGQVVETYSCFSFPFCDRGQRCGVVSLSRWAKVRVLTLGHIHLWRRAEECHQGNIDVKPLWAHLGFYPGQDARNVDKLGAIWIMDRLVRPAFRDSATPGKYGFLVREANPMIGVNVKGSRLWSDVAGSAADPHYRRMLGRCVASGTQL